MVARVSRWKGRRKQVDPVWGKTDNPWDRVAVPGIMFGLVLASGTVSYRVLGLGWFDAFYQTLITVSTVGYTEIGTEITAEYRLVTSLLILFGVGVGLYWIGLIFEAVMEGRLTDHVGRSRMRREIDNTEGHIIVCGLGRVGKAIVDSLQASGEKVVVIDCRPEVCDIFNGLVVTGDATDDNVLLAAGIQRAASLVVALDAKGDNLFVTLSGRALNPNLFIVTRSAGDKSAAKLMHAGANRVVSPYEIGAGRMASFVMQPNVADFLNETMADNGFQVRLGEIEVSSESALADRSLHDSGFLQATGLTLLAVRKCDGSFTHRRDPECVPLQGEKLIVLGTPEQHYAGIQWQISSV